MLPPKDFANSGLKLLDRHVASMFDFDRDLSAPKFINKKQAKPLLASQEQPFNVIDFLCGLAAIADLAYLEIQAQLDELRRESRSTLKAITAGRCPRSRSPSALPA